MSLNSDCIGDVRAVFRKCSLVSMTTLCIMARVLYSDGNIDALMKAYDDPLLNYTDKGMTFFRSSLDNSILLSSSAGGEDP